LLALERFSNGSSCEFAVYDHRNVTAYLRHA
jgi:hypothetical protein